MPAGRLSHLSPPRVRIHPDLVHGDRIHPLRRGHPWGGEAHFERVALPQETRRKTMQYRVWRTIMAGVMMLVSTSAAHATHTTEQVCQYGRANAAAKYASCALKALAKLELGGEPLADFG